MAATDHSRSEAAKQRRQDQLQRWLGSETDRTGSEARETTSVSGMRRAKVRFAQGAVFMAACSAGDREEVAALLRQGADINHANIDGLTALHQVGKLTSTPRAVSLCCLRSCSASCRPTNTNVSARRCMNVKKEEKERTFIDPQRLRCVSTWQPQKLLLNRTHHFVIS